MIRVLHYGLGPVGRNIAQRLQQVSGFQSVAAVDVAADIVGRSLAEILGMQDAKLAKVIVSHSFKKKSAQVALHATASWLKDIEEQLAALLKAGLHVVSTAEELVYPIEKNKKIIARLDRLAKKNQVAFIGVGVNPGFVLDLLPSVLSQVTINIEHIRTTRVVDLRTRRVQLQRKVGLGMSPKEFEVASRHPHFGHQGMRESLAFLAAGLRLKLKRVYTSIKPVIAPEDFTTEHFHIRAGQVAGMQQVAIGYVGGKERLRLEVKMIVAGDQMIGESFDEIEVKGNPPLFLSIPRGIPGETATAAAVINVIPRILDAKPGFLTLLDLPLQS